jgi:hypothetical protein
MLLGVMAFTEAGKIHCDISAYNLLLINPEKHYGGLKWFEHINDGPKSDVWTRTASGTHPGTEGKLSNPKPNEG